VNFSHIPILGCDTLFVLLVVMVRWSLHPIFWLTPSWMSNLDNYSIWTLSVPLRFAPWTTSGMFLSSLMTVLVTLEFSSWKVRMKCLNTFGAWLWGWTMSIPTAWKLFAVTMGPSSGMPHSINFALSMILISSFLPHVFLNRMELWNKRIIDISYAALQAHEIINVALHREYSPGIIFIFSQGRKNLYHV
jgi:hypothetical protein